MASTQDTALSDIGNAIPHASVPYIPRRGPKTPPIARRIRELQQQDWGDEKELRLHQHKYDALVHVQGVHGCDILAFYFIKDV
jgi:hypothetical protein